MQEFRKAPAVVTAVVNTIIFVVVVTVVADIIFSAFGAQLSPFVTDMGKVAFGSVTTLLANIIAHNERRKDDPVPTTIVQPEDQSVPTHEVKAGEAKASGDEEKGESGDA